LLDNISPAAWDTYDVDERKPAALLCELVLRECLLACLR
jgi:hypothetical protein